VNEWLLLHGSDYEACTKICEVNFSLDHAGAGATWKDTAPLYGHGLYFAERITKADEYAKLVPPAVAGEASLHCVLLCRVVGGRVCECTTDRIDAEALRTQVLHGRHHSVLGDRVRHLGKPFREVVIHDSDQVYPEYLLMYSRDFVRRPATASRTASGSGP